jgi:hypothetical protein
MSKSKTIKVIYTNDVPEEDFDIIKEYLIEIVKRLLHGDGDTFEGVIEIDDRVKYHCAAKIENGQAKALVASDAVMEEQPSGTTLH